MAEDSRDAVMMPLRLHASDIGPANSMVTASTALVSDKDSALIAAGTPNCLLNCGIRGCTQ